MQSIWCDFIQDDFLDGDFGVLLSRGISGATSNPSIFKNALINDANYRARLAALPKGLSAAERFERIAAQDITKAAHKMAHIHAANAREGFISYEISPLFAHDYAKSVDAALKIASDIAVANLMIKLPATKEGIRAMRTLAAKGININATLVFSPEQAREAAAAIKDGCEEFIKKQPNAALPQAVISIFVSRLDSALNHTVGEKYKIGIANAILCAHEVAATAKSQTNIRALFASTGTKCPQLAPDYYIKALAFNDTINTAPLAAIAAAQNALCKDGYASAVLSAQQVDSAREFLAQVNEHTLQSAYSSLLADGLAAFVADYEQILELSK